MRGPQLGSLVSIYSVKLKQLWREKHKKEAAQSGNFSGISRATPMDYGLSRSAHTGTPYIWTFVTGVVLQLKCQEHPHSSD